MASLENDISDLTREAVAKIEPGVVTDVVEALAQPIPLLVIAKLLGIPRDDWRLLQSWSDAFAVAGSVGSEPGSEARARFQMQMAECALYFAEQFADRRANPRDDLLTAVQQEVEGEVLDQMDQLGVTLVLLTAGNETTQTLISGGVKLLAEHPDQRLALVDRPDAVPNAMEELLRWVTPVTTFCRTAMERIELRGRTIERGDYLVSIFGSANRDEDIWDRPDVLDVLRKPDPGHVAFGFGQHFCMGARLARLESRIVFSQLLQRFAHFDLVGKSERTPTVVARYPSLPVVFHERSAD
jgi:cytochrome P450